MAGAGQLSLRHRHRAGFGWPTAGRLSARLQSLLRRSSLDRAIAAGADPRRSAALTERAARLVGARNRDQLRRALVAVREAAESPGGPLSSAVPPNRRELAMAEDEMTIIDEMLCSDRPIAPRGAALLRIMLTDPAGPMYAPPTRGALKHHLCAVIDALDGVRSAA